MRRFFLLVFLNLFSIVLICGCYVGNKALLSSDTILEIEFQDFFDQDTIAFEIDNCKIFENQIITSGKVLGTTDLTVSFFSLRNYKTGVKYLNKFITCKHKYTGVIKAKVTINSIVHELQFDPINGKYFGLNVGINNKLDILQLRRPFSHE